MPAHADIGDASSMRIAGRDVMEGVEEVKEDFGWEVVDVSHCNGCCSVKSFRAKLPMYPSQSLMS